MAHTTVSLSVSSFVQTEGFAAPAICGFTSLPTGVGVQEETESGAIEDDEAPTQRNPRIASAPKPVERKPISKKDVREYLERRARVLSPSVTLVTKEAVEKAAYEEICFLRRHAIEQENIGSLVAVVTDFVAKSFTKAEAEAMVADMKRKAETEKPRFSVKSVKSSMAKAEDKADQAARLLGILFREGERYSDVEGRNIAVEILNGLDHAEKVSLLTNASDPAQRIHDLIAVTRGVAGTEQQMLAAAGDTVRALIHDADWPMGRAAAILRVLLEDEEGHNAFHEGDALAEVVKDALLERVKIAMSGAKSAEVATEKANSVFYCLMNPIFADMADELGDLTHDLLLSWLMAQGASLTDAEGTVRNLRAHPTDPRKRGQKQPQRREVQEKPKAKPVETVANPQKVESQEEIRAFFNTVTGAIADAERNEKDAKAKRAEPKAEKAQASTAKGPEVASLPLSECERGYIAAALMEYQQVEADAQARMNAVRGDMNAFHDAVEAHKYAKAWRKRFQQTLEADSSLRKEQEEAAMKAEKAKRPEPKDEKKSKKDRKHDAPERERHARA